MAEQKKRAVCSYENMNEEVAAAFQAKYPKGYADFLPDLKEYPKPDGTSFYAVTIELSTAIYLVKIKVKVDDVEDLERWLDENEGEDSGVGGESDGDSLPDDNISQYTTGDDDSGDTD